MNNKLLKNCKIYNSKNIEIYFLLRLMHIFLYIQYSNHMTSKARVQIL